MALSAEAWLAARVVVSRFDTMGIGLADASIVVLADRYGVSEILTLDERYFRLLPTDRALTAT